MKLHYYQDTDALYIELSPKAGVDSREVAEGVVLDFDSEGNVVGMDIQGASKKMDLKTLETFHLPKMKIKTA